MNPCHIYLSGYTPALGYAAKELSRHGFPPAADISDATHLLLPVPSFDADGSIRGGGSLETLLARAPKDITIIGGSLDRSTLEEYRTLDLLQDPLYTAKNAYLTACCAIKLAMNKLPVVLTGQKILVIGWGRIGKCLSSLLRGYGAMVTVAVRSTSDRAMLRALGYQATDTAKLETADYRVIFNTVPAMLLPQCSGDALKIDLASKPGLGGLDVIWARGLPAKEAPESSGQLIAHTVLSIIKKGGSL